MSLRFDGKVAIVTGAGGGLGKEYALLLAERGASVVVNDLGGSRKGEGQSHSPADIVVQEIRKKGGKAVANYDSVEDGEKIVQTALDAFGRIDILINNAGILRDRSFIKITDEDWDLIHRVHLRGAFKVTRSAWVQMKEQGFGRIIMTSSGAGIYGNFGQTNYSAAKMGLIGLSNSLAVEGSKYGIHSNVIIPVAASRLTEGILPPDIFEQMKPTCVAPVVAWLCHENCEENGGIYEAAGGWVGKYRWQRSLGDTFVNSQSFTIEDVRDHWKKITEMENGTFPSSVQENISLLAESLESAKEAAADNDDDSVDDGVNVDKILNTKIPSQKFSYGPNDAILYALGVGVKSTDEDYLKFVYEGSEDFSVLPTFGVIPAQRSLFSCGIFSGNLRGFKIDVSKILHGEQYLEILKPLPSEETLTCNTYITDVLDKGSGAVILIQVDSFDKNGDLIIKNQFTVFIVGSGGFNGKRTSGKTIPIPALPSSPPDKVLTSKTTTDQPALYRLSGDFNPLHIDPNFAALGGFSKPIFHGLCSFGMAGRHVLKAYANNDVTKFKAIKVRFTKPVYPGETLQTEMWKNGNRIMFQTKILERNNIAVMGFVDLTQTADVQHTSITEHQLESEPIFNAIADVVSTNSSLGKDINGCFEWNITKDGQVASTWTLNFKQKPYSVFKGQSKDLKPDVILTLSDEDMVALAGNKLKPQQAFMSGKLKIKGNVMLTQKLQKLFQAKSNL